MACFGTSLFSFSAELWRKSDIITRNEAGQPQADWVLEKTVSCDFMPARAEERLVGRIQNPVAYNVFVSGGEHETVTVDKQLRNLKDGDGNVVEEGPFNIIGVRKHMGFTHVDYMTVSAQKVLD